mgnify:CR=1 FL=1
MKRNNARTHVFEATACMSALLIAGCLAGCTPDNAGQTQAGGEGAAGSSAQNTQTPQGTKVEQDAQNAPSSQSTQADQAKQADDNQSGQAIQAAKAVALEHTEAHETLQTHTVKSADLAQKIYEAYLKGEAGDAVDMISSDYDDTLVFTFDDGSTLTAEFNAHNLRDGDTYRTFDDKGGLWKLLAEMSD